MSEIFAFWHCAKCLEELPPGESPGSYQRIEAGWTERGLQVRCRRHDVNIIHIDFEGHQHRADLSEAGNFGGEHVTKQ